MARWPPVGHERGNRQVRIDAHAATPPPRCTGFLIISSSGNLVTRRSGSCGGGRGLL